jgi:hypothetical protein
VKPRRLVGLLLVASCSTLLGKYPPAKLDRGAYPECGTPGSAMLYDGGAAVIGVLFLVSTAGEGDSGAALVGSALAIAFGASLANGIAMQNRCSEAHRKADPLVVVKPLRLSPPLTAGAPDGSAENPRDAGAD